MLPSKFKRNLIAAMVVPALAAPAAVLAAGQQQERQGQAGATQQQIDPAQQQIDQQGAMQFKPDDRRASQLIGMDVRSPQDENLGEIRDLVIDTQTGKIEYVALAHGGFLGLGEDLYAYPLDAFEPAPDRDQLVLNVTREQLQQAQGFSSDDWPKVREDRGFWDRVTDAFGRDRTPAAGATAPAQPTTGEAAAGATAPQQPQQVERQPADATPPAAPQAQPQLEEQQFIRASDLKGEQVRDQAGAELGQIEDLVVNMGDGEVRFAVIDTAGDDRMVPVSMEDIQVVRDNDRTTVQYTKDKLDLSQAFDRDQWPEALRAQQEVGQDRPAAQPAAGGQTQPATSEEPAASAGQPRN
jgi:sporulation protein YlmC with PRC-barrel domain